jgi:hypothetical protein
MTPPWCHPTVLYIPVLPMSCGRYNKRSSDLGGALCASLGVRVPLTRECNKGKVARAESVAGGALPIGSGRVAIRFVSIS